MNKLIIVVFNLPWNWIADYQKQTVLSLSRLGFKVVVYLDSNSEFFIYTQKQKYPKIKNVYFYSPRYIVPFKRFQWVESVNQFVCLNYLALRYGINRKLILWIFNYKHSSFPVMLLKNSISIYDCVELPTSRNNKNYKEIVKKNEILIQNSDYFFVDSPTLFNYFKNKKPIIVPQGFDPIMFNKKESRHLSIYIPQNKPVIGYIGGINYRLDYNLIYSLVKNNPQWNFVFVGKIDVWREEDQGINTNKWVFKLNKFDNFHIFDQQPKDTIPLLLDKFSVCLIPYNVDIMFNYYSRAMKTYEYLFLGKPIVSTPILESVRLKDFISIADTATTFEMSIRKHLNRKYSKSEIQRIKKFCMDNSWDSKIRKIVELSGI